MISEGLSMPVHVTDSATIFVCRGTSGNQGESTLFGTAQCLVLYQLPSNVQSLFVHLFNFVRQERNRDLQTENV